MHVVVVGATGNVGTAVLRALQTHEAVRSVLGVARRPPPQPRAPDDKVRWHAADISRDPLDFVAGADAVVHLAWLIQPSREENVMRATNVGGTRRLVDEVIANGVPSFIYASSVGTYAPAPKDTPLGESWPRTGVPTSTYSRHKAEVESLLDVVERDHPQLRLVRMRTSLVFQRAAAAEVHRLFLGRLMPWHLPRPFRFVPGLRRLVFQATHADDIADAYVRALTRDVSGAFNIAAEPPLTPQLIAEAVGGRVLPLPERLLRVAVSAAHTARLVPTEAGWLDMATNTPLMDTTRGAPRTRVERDPQLGRCPHRTARRDRRRSRRRHTHARPALNVPLVRSGSMTGIAATAMTTILAVPDRVYDAIVRADTVTSFFPDRSSGDLVAGTEVTWEFDHADAKVQLRVGIVRAPSSIVFDWNAAGDGFKTVTFSLESLDDGRATRVEVTEAEFPVNAPGAAKAVQQSAGWSEFLCFLKARIQFDVELRTGRKL